MASHISKKRKFVADGVFRAELNDFLARELSEEGYSGCDVRVTHARTEVRSVCLWFREAQELTQNSDHHPCHPHPRSFG